MSTSTQLKKLSVISILVLSMIHCVLGSSQTKAAASGHPVSHDSLIQSSSRNSSNVHNGNNNTKQNEMSIQICDKSHPCKSLTPNSGLQ
jgi:hypothetical protein